MDSAITKNFEKTGPFEPLKKQDLGQEADDFTG
jgi:hypothetical protein